MIIAVDTNSILPGQVGGIENYTLGLVEALKLPESPASRVVLLTRPENHSLFAPFADSRTEVVQLERSEHDGKPVANWPALLAENPAAGQRALAQFQQSKRLILQRHGVQVVHFPGNTINPLDLDFPIVLNLHDLQHRHFPQYFSEMEIRNREKWWVASARRADALIAASNYVRDDLHDQLGVSRDRIFVTPDAFQATFFQKPSREELAALRRRLELPKMFFLYPAAMWQHKNHDRLVQAFVAAGLPRAQLILTGGGQEGSSISGANVRLLGRVSTGDLVGLYHLATALLFPSEHESWSIPVMEAMSCGCPVACSNVTSLPEEIADAGLLFDPHDIAGMTAVIQRLANEPTLRAQLIKRGRARVTDFSPARFITTVGRAYQHALQTYHHREAA